MNRDGIRYIGYTIRKSLVLHFLNFFSAKHNSKLKLWNNTKVTFAVFSFDQILNSIEEVHIKSVLLSAGHFAHVMHFKMSD